MIFQHKLLLILLTLACWLYSSASYSSSTAQNNILILGDSISAAYGMDLKKGWAALLQERLMETDNHQYNVINASVSGNTSGDGLSRLPPLLEKYKPAIVIIELGGNDGLRGYPVRTLEKNLQRMIDLSLQANAKVILAGIEIPPNYGQRYTDLFRTSFQKVAEKNEVEFIPFILDKIALNPELMQDDGIHPTAEAQRILLENFWPSIKSLL